MPAGRPKGSGSGSNKSAAIRIFMENNPMAGTNEIIDGLAKSGVDVSQALVSNVRGRVNRGPGNKSRKGAITVDELQSIHMIVEKFEDPSLFLGIVEDINGLITKLGGFERFQQAMKDYSNFKPSEMKMSETDPEDSDSDSDDSDDSDDDSED